MNRTNCLSFVSCAFCSRSCFVRQIDSLDFDCLFSIFFSCAFCYVSNSISAEWNALLEKIDLLELIASASRNIKTQKKTTKKWITAKCESACAHDSRIQLWKAIQLQLLKQCIVIIFVEFIVAIVYTSNWSALTCVDESNFNCWLNCIQYIAISC